MNLSNMGDKDQASLYISAKVSYVYHLSATTFIAPDFAGNELDIYFSNEQHLILHTFYTILYKCVQLLSTFHVPFL